MKLLWLFIAVFPFLAGTSFAGNESKDTKTREDRYWDDVEEVRNLLVQTGVWMQATRSVFRQEDLDAKNLKMIEAWSRDARNLLADGKSATANKARNRFCGQAEKLLERWERFEDLPAEKSAGPVAVSVRGLVANPGTHRSDGPLALSQSIQLAGGFHPLGKPECVALYRNAHLKIYNLKSRDTADPPLRSGDMVVVESGWFADGDVDPFAEHSEPTPPPAVSVPSVDFSPEQVRTVLGREALDELHLKAPEPPARIRVQTRTIEMPLAEYLATFNGKRTTEPGALYRAARELVAEGKAKIVGASILTTKENQRSTLESIREMISPCEPEPPTPPNSIGAIVKKYDPGFPYLRPSASFTAFETRNLGETLEIEAEFAEEHPGFLNLCLAPEYVFLVGMTTWQPWTDRYGRGDARRPLYYTQRTNTSLDLAIGTFQYICTFVPMKPDGSPEASRKWLFFVKADVYGSP